MLNWIEIVEWRARRHPDRLLFSDADVRLTYGEFVELVDRRAGGWAQRGVGPGSVVALVERNSVSYLVNVFAISRAGGVAALVNWRLGPTEIATLIEIVDPVAVAAGPEHVGDVEAVSGSLPRVFLGDGVAPTGWSAEAELDAPPPQRADRIDPTTPFALLFSSGTTGRPKAIPLTHQALLRTAVSDVLGDPAMGNESGARHLMFLPLFHLAGFASALYAPYAGGMVHIQRAFDPEAVFRAVEELRIEHLYAAPAIFAALIAAAARRPIPPDMSSLHEVSYGAAPIPEELLAGTVELFACRLRQNYGLTESAGPVTTLDDDDHRGGPRRRRTAGRAALGYEVRVVEPDGTICASDTPGLVEIRGGGLFPGYWTAAGGLVPQTDEHGWFRTGDIGSVDPDRYLTLLDRANDLVITGGENVYPAEVESVLYEHPAIADVAVIGVPDATWGESVHAVVVPVGDSHDAEAIIAWARQRLAHFKCPRSVSFVDQLPRNAGGKLLKRVIREPFWAGTDRGIA